MLKVCTTCNKEKDPSLFYKRSAAPDGLTNRCKECTNISNKKWAKENREASLKIKAKYRENNRDSLREKSKEYHAKNEEKRRITGKAWREANRGHINFLTARRRARLAQRTPEWVKNNKEEMQQIKELYLEARRLTEETGIPHHVDHIIPLFGDTVSGFHCLSNLQIITAEDNMKKGNKFEPERFKEQESHSAIDKTTTTSDRCSS